jgi:hypothetical protein
MENENIQPPVIEGGYYRGEQIIFDTVIKGKLAHVIVIKEGSAYHLNLDGEDIGGFTKDEAGKIHRYQQPKGAILEPDEYFTAIEEKLKEMDK